MKVKVKFVPIYNRRSFTFTLPSPDEPYSSPYSSFTGSGTILLHEIGIFLEGEMPKLKLGWLFRFAFIGGFLWFLYSNIISSKTIITIPYAKVLKYRRRGTFGNIHVIVYELSESLRRKGDQERITIRFKFSKSNKQYEKKFSDRLNEYVNDTKFLLTKE